jgi:hypothetical protein
MLGIACSSTSGCYISIRCRGLCIPPRVIVLLLGVSLISIAQLIVGLLQIGSGIPLSPGSVSLLNESTRPRHFFRWLRPLSRTAPGKTAREHGGRDKSYESW